MTHIAQHMPYSPRTHQTPTHATTVSDEDHHLRAVVWLSVAAFTVLFWGMVIYLIVT